MGRTADAATERYLGITTGHWMRPKLEGGQSVALDDGSLWEVGVLDRLNTMLWLLNEDTMVTENGGGNTPCPYKRANTVSRDAAEAVPIGSAR